MRTYTDRKTTKGHSSHKQVNGRQKKDTTSTSGTTHNPVSIQTKLATGEPGDKYEEEMMTAQQPGVQMKRNTALPEEVQMKMESAFGESFANVNIHKNSPQAKDLNALAFTQGNDVHFAPGQFNPNSQRGQELIGHEFAHVKQQREGRVKPTVQTKGVSINNDEHLEREADEMGKKAVQAKFPENKAIYSKYLPSPDNGNGVTQLALPAVFTALGAAEWIALGALGYSVVNDAVNSASGDIGYSFDEVEGVLLPGGGNDVAAHKRAHPNAKIYDATHHFAIWGGTRNLKKIGIKFGINFLYDDAGAIGNISLSLLDVYDWVGYGGNINVNITPRSLSGSASFRFTVNIGEDNSWFVPNYPGSIQMILRGGDGDLRVSRNNYFGFTEIS